MKDTDESNALQEEEDNGETNGETQAARGDGSESEYGIKTFRVYRRKAPQ